MPIFDSAQRPVDPWLAEQWYNSLDCCVTHEIFERLDAEHGLGPNSPGMLVYDFERSMQGPALDMMLRGFRIDPVGKSRAIHDLVKIENGLQETLNRLARAVWGQDLNPRSSDQVQAFFYGAMKLPEVWLNFKGVSRITVNREALEKLYQYYLARPFINLIFGIRDTSKKLGVLRSGVSSDGRMRCTYNVCGTETGRWASSKNVFGGGTNLQNITEELRRIFIADPGFMILYLDGEQAESRACGLIHGDLFDDWKYLDACEAGDLHTTVAMLVWPELGWTSDQKRNREIADQQFYRWFSYRDMAKRGGHLSNYKGSAWMMARTLKLEIAVTEAFRKSYIEAFPAFPRWWQSCAERLMATQSLVTFLGRERTFFGRPNDDSTLREFVAYEPQSAVGDLINRGGYAVWKKYCLQPDSPLQILGQIHDAFIFQIKETHLNLIPEISRTFEVPVTALRGRKMIIPAEAKLGWNWASFASSEDVSAKRAKVVNPDGLRKWKGPGTETRRRTENPEAGLLDRVLY